MTFHLTKLALSRLCPCGPEDEEWRIVGRNPNYAVSTHGRVSRVKDSITHKARRRALKPGLSNGYLFVNLCDGKGNRRNDSIALLVLEAFVGPRPLGLVINHLDFNKENNRVDNLEWTTQSRNVQHAYDAGRRDCRGEGNGFAKLTESEVLEIRAKYTGTWGDYTRLGREYEVNSATISDIIKGLTWAHI